MKAAPWCSQSRLPRNKHLRDHIFFNRFDHHAFFPEPARCVIYFRPATVDLERDQTHFRRNGVDPRMLKIMSNFFAKVQSIGSRMRFLEKVNKWVRSRTIPFFVFIELRRLNGKFKIADRHAVAPTCP